MKVNNLKPAAMANILLVDDHDDTAQAQRVFLQKRGHNVQTAGSVSEAHSIADTQKLDLVVCDIRLPDGNGLDLVSELWAKYRLRGIALTGVSDVSVGEGTEREAWARVLNKPVGPERLLETVEAVLAEPSEKGHEYDEGAAGR